MSLPKLLARRALARLRSPDDAMSLCAVLWRHHPSVPVVVALLDRRGGLLDLWPLSDATEADLPQVIELAARVDRRVRRLLVVTDRTDEVPVDRPDDELVWEELRGQAAAAGLVLVDWYVRSGRYAFSLAEFAPSPAGW